MTQKGVMLGLLLTLFLSVVFVFVQWTEVEGDVKENYHPPIIEANAAAHTCSAWLSPLVAPCSVPSTSFVSCTWVPRYTISVTCPSVHDPPSGPTPARPCSIRAGTLASGLWLSRLPARVSAQLPAWPPDLLPPSLPGFSGKTTSCKSCSQFP